MEQRTETICLRTEREVFSWQKGLTGTWGMVWFKDQLEKYEPVIDRVEKVALIEDFADAMAIVEHLNWETAGNDIQNEIQAWFDQHAARVSLCLIILDIFMILTLPSPTAKRRLFK